LQEQLETSISCLTW